MRDARIARDALVTTAHKTGGFESFLAASAAADPQELAARQDEDDDADELDRALSFSGVSL